REYSPKYRLNAAPGLYASVNRRNSPSNSCGVYAGTSVYSAMALVITSIASAQAPTPQNNRDFIRDACPAVCPTVCTRASTGVCVSELDSDRDSPFFLGIFLALFA